MKQTGESADSLLFALAHVEKETIAYFPEQSVYDTTQAEQDLGAAGNHCPDLRAYMAQAVAFYKQHRANHEKLIAVR